MAPNIDDMNSSVECLSRRELQRELKKLKLPAVGTTKVLQDRYMTYLHENHAQQPPTTTTEPASPAEKRGARYRTSCPSGIRTRISRALHQRLYLIEGRTTAAGSVSSSAQFAVLGSTGNVYDVKIGTTAHCTCPDHGRSYLCKHILFVLLKVLRVDADSPLVYQAAWLSSEVDTLLEGWTARQQEGVLANERVLETYAEMKNPDGKRSAVDEKNDEGCRKPIEPDTDCPICFDNLGSEELAYCRVACGTNFHNACMERWGSTSGYYGTRKTLTCPNCRSPWEDPTKDSCSKRGRQDEGYTNLGDLQGQSREPDTSMYAGY